MTNARAAAAAGALVVLSAARIAAADLKLHTEVSPRKVEIGDRIVVRFSITSDSRDSISDPKLAVPDAVKIFGQSVAQGSGVTITWMLAASRAGKFKIGPASVQTSKGRRSDKPTTIEVVAQGTLSNKQPPLSGQPSSPFNMLRGFGGQGFPNLPGFPGFPGEPEAAPELPPLPEGYKVERALDATAFVVASAEPRQVVIGEQVTLSEYAYGGRGDFGLVSLGEPTRDDFLGVAMSDEDGSLKYPFDLDGRRWLVAKVASVALFPLKAGVLKIGSAGFGFTGPGYSSTPQGLARRSLPLELEVVEPPIKGRPPGYHLGDVGRFKLSVQVQPREIPVDGSISVIAKLEGSGNLPFTLLVPEQSGVHFLEPQLTEQIVPRRGVVEGSRTFSYIVELTRPGELELGDITLPYYDPKARAYGVARAALGTVKVTGSAKPPSPTVSAGSKTGGPSLKGLLTPPAKLGASVGDKPSYLPSRVSFWLVLLGLPLSALLGFALSDLAKLLRRRLADRRGSLNSALDDALNQLAQVTRAGDAAKSASAAERALFLAIERATGLKARGVLKVELASALAEANVPAAVGSQAAELLGYCDELRFAGTNADLSRFGSEVRAVCQTLGQPRPATAGPTA